MSFSAVTRRVLLGFLSVALLFCVSRIQAQSEMGTLRGTITDPSGAAVVGATATVTPSSGQPITATSNDRMWNGSSTRCTDRGSDSCGRVSVVMRGPYDAATPGRVTGSRDRCR